VFSASVEQGIADNSTKYGVRPQLIRADIMHESGGNALAVGDGGLALGPMQVHPAACQEVGVDWHAIQAAIAAGDEPTAARLGIEAGVAYLAKMLKLMGWDEAWALGAFNQGETVIGKARSYATAVIDLIE